MIKLKWSLELLVMMMILMRALWRGRSLRAQPKGALHGAGSSWGRPRVRQCGEAFWVMRVVRPVVEPVGQLAS